MDREVEQYLEWISRAGMYKSKPLIQGWMDLFIY